MSRELMTIGRQGTLPKAGSAAWLDYKVTRVGKTTPVMNPQDYVAYGMAATPLVIAIDGGLEIMNVLNTLRSDVAGLVIAVHELHTAVTDRADRFCTYIMSLASPQLSVRQPIPVTIRADGDEFIASLLEANISTGGDDVPNAISNLQSLIADIFIEFQSCSDDVLGPSMKKQRDVLRELICLKS